MRTPMECSRRFSVTFNSLLLTSCRFRSPSHPLWASGMSLQTEPLDRLQIVVAAILPRRPAPTIPSKAYQSLPTPLKIPSSGYEPSRRRLKTSRTNSSLLGARRSKRDAMPEDRPLPQLNCRRRWQGLRVELQVGQIKVKNDPLQYPPSRICYRRRRCPHARLLPHRYPYQDVNIPHPTRARVQRRVRTR
jgi:hypothetical protein